MSIKIDKLKDDDFKDLKYNIIKPAGMKTTGYKKIYPDIRQYEEFNVRVTNTFPKNPDIKFDTIFQYIVLMYDMNSPFVKQVDETGERKRYVLKYIGAIDQLNEEPDETWTKIIQNKYYFISKMILRYCMLQRNLEYTMYQMASERLHKFNLEAMDDVNKSKQLDDIYESAIRYQKKFLAGKDQTLATSLERYIGELTYPISPEEIAEHRGRYPYEDIALKAEHEIVDPFQKYVVKKKKDEQDSELG